MRDEACDATPSRMAGGTWAAGAGKAEIRARISIRPPRFSLPPPTGSPQVRAQAGRRRQKGAARVAVRREKRRKREREEKRIDQNHQPVFPPFPAPSPTSPCPSPAARSWTRAPPPSWTKWRPPCTRSRRLSWRATAFRSTSRPAPKATSCTCPSSTASCSKTRCRPARLRRPPRVARRSSPRAFSASCTSCAPSASTSPSVTCSTRTSSCLRLEKGRGGGWGGCFF